MPIWRRDGDSAEERRVRRALRRRRRWNLRPREPAAAHRVRPGADADDNATASEAGARSAGGSEQRVRPGASSPGSGGSRSNASSARRSESERRAVKTAHRGARASSGPSNAAGLTGARHGAHEAAAPAANNAGDTRSLGADDELASARRAAADAVGADAPVSTSNRTCNESEPIASDLMTTLTQAAASAQPHLTKRQQAQVTYYMERLRLLRELSGEFAAYDALCRPRFSPAVAKIRALAFCGGGVLGTAYVGALSVLERHGLQYSRVRKLAGTSAGAIMASALAVGYDAAGCMEQLLRLDFKDLVAPDFVAVTRGRGFSTGAYLERWMGDVLRHRTGSANITMGEVLQRYGRELVIVTTELDTGRERKLTPHADPDLPVKTAVRMSAGIPVVFDMYVYQGHQYCDGGLLNNWPVDELPSDDTGIGMVTFSFEDFINHKLFRTLWRDVPASNSRFQFEDVGEAFAQQMARHSQKASSMMDVAKQSMRVVYDRLTREQLQRHLESKPGSIRMPRAAFLCVGEYGAMDVDISRSGQMELFELGRLSMFVEVQRFMLERTEAVTDSTLTTKGGGGQHERGDAEKEVELRRKADSNPSHARSQRGVDAANAARTSTSAGGRSGGVQRNSAGDFSDAVESDGCDDGERGEDDDFISGNATRHGVASCAAASAAGATDDTSACNDPAARQRDATELRDPAAGTNIFYDANSAASTRELSSLAPAAPLADWCVPDDLYWRLFFFLWGNESKRFGKQVPWQVFPGRVIVDEEVRLQRGRRAPVLGKVRRAARSVWNHVRFLFYGCCAVSLQCATCCQAHRCMHEQEGFGAHGYVSLDADGDRGDARASNARSSGGGGEGGDGDHDDEASMHAAQSTEDFDESLSDSPRAASVPTPRNSMSAAAVLAAHSLTQSALSRGS